MDKPPKIRDDLIIRELTGKDSSRNFVIKDPLTGLFFQVREPEYFIISSFDGTRRISDIAVEFTRRFNLEIDAASIEGFAAHLQTLCFLDNDLTRQELLLRQREATREPKRSLFGRLLFIKLKAINPGRLFDRLITRVRLFFTPHFVAFAILLILFALLLSMNNSRDIVRGMGEIFTIHGIIIFYLSMLTVAVLHEFAHGLTCKYYGGEVRDIGFLLMYFQPAFYCNVSDAWLFTEKRKRLWVSFSGGFFQLFIWSLSVLVWRITATDTTINLVALAVMVFSGIATLFNFNPLLKYDGYYLLSDYLEIPNLRQKAGRYWKGLLRRLLSGLWRDDPGYSLREKRIYFYYGILSFIYVVFILGYFFLILAQFLVSRLGGTGFLIFAAIMLFLFRNLIMDAVKETGKAVKAEGSFLRRWPGRITAAVILIGLILLVAFVKIELRVKGELEISPRQILTLKYNSAGYAELLQYDKSNRSTGQKREVSTFSSDYTTTRLLPLVSIGDSIVAGQVIARLINTETSHLINEFTARLREAEEQLAILKQGARPQEIEEARNTVREMQAKLDQSSLNLTRINEMYSKNLVAKQAWEDARADSLVWDARLKGAQNRLYLLKAGTRPEEINAKVAEIDRLKSQIEFHSRQQEAYEIKATISGTVLHLDTGETVCEIANLDTVEAMITLSEKELADIGLGQKVKFKVRGYPELSFYGEVYRIDNKIVENLDGDRVFQTACLVPNDAHLLRPGMTGVANVYCGKRKISYHIYRKFFRTIRTEFWDWFDWL